MSTRTFDTSSTIGGIVATHPALARVFERLGIDYCCGGKRTLAQVCATKGLEPQTVVVILEAALEAAPATTGRAPVDVLGMRLSVLADHIESTHHAYLKTELPGLVEKADRVAAKHGWRDARLPEVATTIRAFAHDMFHHMHDEETVVFPAVRALEANPATASRSALESIRQMEAEHDVAGRQVARLRELTDGFAPTAESCNTHRALLAVLADVERDLHEHVHKENNVLFPRALAGVETR